MKKLLTAAVLAAAVNTAYAANVLVVLSDESRLELRDNKFYETGFYANELMQPVKKLIEAGHKVTFATPRGKAPSVDRNSLDAMYFGGTEQMKQHLALLDKLNITSPSNSPVLSLPRVEQLGYEQFDAVYIPGGHAPMQDLIHDAEVGKLLRHFHKSNKTTALVCHGPAALLSAQESGGWIYSGYKMTVISNKEEEAAKGYLGGGEMKATPETLLTAAGGKYSSGPNWNNYVVADRELITGQNPASAAAVADLLLSRLATK